MPLFSSAQNLVFNSSHLTDLTVNSTGSTAVDILLEASLPEAAHDSSARDPPPRCFPGTREQYVEDLVNWVLPAAGDTPLPIYWMKGPAGVGKSAVAQTCVEALKQLRKLGAAFFFSINRHNDISNKGEHYKFFTSVAYQLSTAYPDYRNLLDAKIRCDKSLVDKTLESQFLGLIVEPLQELEEIGGGIGKRVPVFVDGLDECESQDAQCEIIEIVAAAARRGATPLCWAFFSRPEPHIEAMFSDAEISPLCHKTTLPVSRDADGDIELYLRAGLENVFRRRNISMSPRWPTHTDMRKLVRAAGGLFIYAKTLLRFIDQPDSLDPQELLRVVLDFISNRYQHGNALQFPFAELDAFYILIMQRIAVNMLPSIRLVLTLLCWGAPLSAVVSANTLGLSRVELETICNQMSAVVHFQRRGECLPLNPTIEGGASFLSTSPSAIPTEVYHTVIGSLGGSISFYHKSFQDFLLDPTRSGTYSVNTFPMSEALRGQEEIELEFERRYYWRGSELVRAPNVPDSTSCLSYPAVGEHINSFITAWIYGGIDANIKPGENFDYRKRLYVQSRVVRTLSPGPPPIIPCKLHRRAGLSKYIQRTMLAQLYPGEFSRFDIGAFKKETERQERSNIIRPHYPKIPLFDKPGDRVESGLYIIGHNSKSIFWYWEIDQDLESYQQFTTLDLAEGQRLYREERFDSWVQRM